MFIIHFCFLLFVNAAAFGLELDGCKIAWCGDDGPTIQFPFWLKDQQPEHCGYPRFELSCTKDNYTMLELPHWWKFYVNSISYTRQWIDLYDLDGCIDPRLFWIPDLTSSPFEYNTYNYTFFNCSTHIDSTWNDLIRIQACLSSTHLYQIVSLTSDEDATSIFWFDLSLRCYGFIGYLEMDEGICFCCRWFLTEMDEGICS